ncbi:MAG: hypothetical protein ACI9KE_003767, partial [Polyangiales bacterium]
MLIPQENHGLELAGTTKLVARRCVASLEHKSTRDELPFVSPDDDNS